jgi:anti-sigma B factor antagonist
MDAQITSKPLPAGRTLIATEGEIDLYVAPIWRSSISAIIDDGARDLVLDFSELEFLDATGLGAMVAILKRLRTLEGSVVLVIPTERIYKIFQVTGLDKVFRLYASVEDALSGKEMMLKALPVRR